MCLKRKKRNCSSPAEFLKSAIITIIKQKMSGVGEWGDISNCCNFVQNALQLSFYSWPNRLQSCFFSLLLLLLPIALSCSYTLLWHHCSLWMAEAHWIAPDRADLEGLILIAQSIVTLSTEQHDWQIWLGNDFSNFLVAVVIMARNIMQLI